MQVSNPSTQTRDNFFIAHLHLCWPIWFSFDKWQGLQVASSLSPKHLEIDLSTSILELQSVSSAHTVPIYFSLHDRYNRVYSCFLFFLCVAFPDLPNPTMHNSSPPKKNWWFHPVLHSSLFISLSFPPHPHHSWKLWICWLL